MSMAQRLISFFWSQSDRAWVMRASEPCVIDTNQFQGNSHSFIRETLVVGTSSGYYFGADAGCVFYLRGGVFITGGLEALSMPRVLQDWFLWIVALLTVAILMVDI